MRLNQVTLPSADLNTSIPFYKKIGFQLIVDARPDYARFLCPDDEATLSLHRCEEIKPHEVSVYFETENPDAEYHTLLKKGITFELPPTDQRWLWREARFRDPDGNLLILYKAGDNRIYPPWRIK